MVGGFLLWQSVHVGASSRESVVGVKQVVSDYCALAHSSDHVSVSACAIWAPEGDLHSLSL